MIHLALIAELESAALIYMRDTCSLCAGLGSLGFGFYGKLHVVARLVAFAI